MILSVFLLLSLQDPAAAADEAVANEIVIIGEKLESWKGLGETKGGDIACKTTKSTGDADIDQIACAAIVGCMTEIQPRMEEILALDLDKAERDRRMAKVSDALAPCMDRRHDAGVDALARKRAEAL